jgi:hypothetical protein
MVMAARTTAVVSFAICFIFGMGAALGVAPSPTAMALVVAASITGALAA